MNCIDGSSNAGSGRRSEFCNVGMERLRDASTRRNDGLHERLPSDPQATFRCHKNCIATNSSKHRIKRHAMFIPEMLWEKIVSQLQNEVTEVLEKRLASGNTACSVEKMLAYGPSSP